MERQGKKQWGNHYYYGCHENCVGNCRCRYLLLQGFCSLDVLDYVINKIGYLASALKLAYHKVDRAAQHRGIVFFPKLGQSNPHIMACHDFFRDFCHLISQNAEPRLYSRSEEHTSELQSQF